MTMRERQRQVQLYRGQVPSRAPGQLTQALPVALADPQHHLHRTFTQLIGAGRPLSGHSGPMTKAHL